MRAAGQIPDALGHLPRVHGGRPRRRDGSLLDVVRDREDDVRVIGVRLRDRDIQHREAALLLDDVGREQHVALGLGQILIAGVGGFGHDVAKHRVVGPDFHALHKILRVQRRLHERADGREGDDGGASLDAHFRIRAGLHRRLDDAVRSRPELKKPFVDGRWRRRCRPRAGHETSARLRLVPRELTTDHLNLALSRREREASAALHRAVGVAARDVDAHAWNLITDAGVVGRLECGPGHVRPERLADRIREPGAPVLDGRQRVDPLGTADHAERVGGSVERGFEIRPGGNRRPGRLSASGLDGKSGRHRDHQRCCLHVRSHAHLRRGSQRLKDFERRDCPRVLAPGMIPQGARDGKTPILSA